jgi:hypothetical protein
VTALAIIQVEGVLAQVFSTLSAAKPINDSLFLYEGLRQHWKIALVTAAATDPDEARHWLKLHSFVKFDHLECMPSRHRLVPLQWLTDDTIDGYRSRGWEIGLYVSADPSVVKLSLVRGVPGMLMTHPLYMRPEHRPDATLEPRPWDTLVQEINQQQEMKANDRRMEAEDVIGGSER